MLYKNPTTVQQVNDNLIHLKSELITAKRELSQIHVRFHKDNLKTPIADIKSLESKIYQLEELIEIAGLQKENIKTNNELGKLNQKIKEQREEIFKLKSKLNNESNEK